MLNQAEAVPGERVFHRNPLRSAVGAVVLSAVLSAATLFLLPRFLPGTMKISTRGVVVLVVAIALTVAVFAGFFWFRNIRIVVRPHEVEIGKPGSRETFARATTAFRSKITEHRTNGLPSGTTRALVVHTGDREITIELPGYTRPLFNELMATLNPIAQPVFDDPVAAARAERSCRRSSRSTPRGSGAWLRASRSPRSCSSSSPSASDCSCWCRASSRASSRR